MDTAQIPSLGIVGPSGLFSGVVPSLQPEQRLMLAILEGAVSDIQKYATAMTGRGRGLFAEADAWMHSTASEQPFDFESICQTLGLDPSYIRAGLQRWCVARRGEPDWSRTVVLFPFRRVNGDRRAISACS
jgi:hypothetical protein